MFKSSIVVRSALIVVLAGVFTAYAESQQAPKPVAPPLPVEKPQAVEKVKVYDENADAKQQIAEALAKANKENRRVLIQWGGNWCGWCIKLHGLYKSNKEIARKLMYEYDVVFVDAGKPVGKNIDLAASYNADVAKHGFPYLTILDANGKVVTNQETGSLENKDQETSPGHDPKLVLDFLTKYQAPYLDAQKVLDDALVQAKKENKRVLLHFGAPWCGWCKKMEAWMARPEIQTLLGKDFVEVKIDQDRMEGGNSLETKFAMPENSGIPWFAFLDANGKVLADCSYKDSKSDKTLNTCFPQDPA